tara:strand:- start:70 stop:651 length:582 start_codon:yes stop_codon:yes gene_type:complete
MRYILLLVLFGVGNLYSQDTTSILGYYVDEFDGSKSLMSPKSIFFTDGGDLRDEAIILQPLVEENEKSGKLKLTTLILFVFDKEVRCLGKGDVLTIIFNEGGKIELTSWNEFNCDSPAKNYFNFSKNDLLELESKTIRGIRLTVKRKYNTITVLKNVTEENSLHFNNLSKEIDGVNNGELVIRVLEGETWDEN